MNIDDYRAMVAQEKEQESQKNDQPPVTKPAEETKPAPTETPAKTTTEETTPSTTTSETTFKIPDKIKIEGIGEVTLDELKNGYLRTQDYTKKTQEVARQRKENEQAVKLLEDIKKNPELAVQVAPKTSISSTLDPRQAQVLELQQQVFDLKLEREIEVLQNKYPDFEVREVLETASKKKIVNLEDAYLLVKSTKQSTSGEDKTVNVNELKKQLREEIIKEMEQEKQSTRTLITGGATTAVTEDKSKKLSDAESKVAKKMKLSDDEYLKWRNKK